MNATLKKILIGVAVVVILAIIGGGAYGIIQLLKKSPPTSPSIFSPEAPPPTTTTTTPASAPTTTTTTPISPPTTTTTTPASPPTTTTPTVISITPSTATRLGWDPMVYPYQRLGTFFNEQSRTLTFGFECAGVTDSKTQIFFGPELFAGTYKKALLLFGFSTMNDCVFRRFKNGTDDAVLVQQSLRSPNNVLVKNKAYRFTIKFYNFGLPAVPLSALDINIAPANTITKFCHVDVFATDNSGIVTTLVNQGVTWYDDLETCNRMGVYFGSLATPQPLTNINVVIE